MKNHNTIKIRGKTAGVVFGDTLRIVKTSQSHFVKKFQGYGVSPSTLQKAQDQGAIWLQLIGYNGEAFKVRITDYLLAAIPANLGFGKQLFMSVKNLRWYTNHKPAYRNEPQPIQPSLFG